MPESPSTALGAPSPEAAFRIRGHHVAYLTPFIMPIGISPENKAGELRDTATFNRGSITSETVDFDALTDPNREPSEYTATYAYDLVGDTEEQATKFQEQLRETFEGFLALADNAPVELISGGEDGVCSACTFRRHCQDDAVAQLDTIQIGVIEDVLTHLASDGAGDVPVRTESGTVATTARAVRRVMGYFAVGGFDFSILYNDAARRRIMYGGVFARPGKPEVALRNELQ